MTRMTDPTSQGTSASISQIIGNQQYADAPRVEERQFRHQAALQQQQGQIQGELNQQQGDIQSAQYSNLNQTNLLRDQQEQAARLEQMRLADTLDRQKIDFLESRKQARDAEWKKFILSQQEPTADLNKQISSFNTDILNVQSDLGTSANAAAMSSEELEKKRTEAEAMARQLTESTASQGTVLAGAVGDGVGDLLLDAGVTSAFKELFPDWKESSMSPGTETLLWASLSGAGLMAVPGALKAAKVLKDGMAPPAPPSPEQQMARETNLVRALASKIGANVDQKLGTAVAPLVARLIEIHHQAAITTDDVTHNQLVNEGRILVGTIEQQSEHKITAYALDHAMDQVITNFTNPEALSSFQAQMQQNKVAEDQQGPIDKAFDAGNVKARGERLGILQETLKGLGQKMARTNPAIILEENKQSPEQIQQALSVMLKKAADASPDIAPALRQEIDHAAILDTAANMVGSSLRTLLKSIAAPTVANAEQRQQVESLTKRLRTLQEARAELQQQRESRQFQMIGSAPYLGN